MNENAAGEVLFPCDECGRRDTETLLHRASGVRVCIDRERCATTISTSDLPGAVAKLLVLRARDADEIAALRAALATATEALREGEWHDWGDGHFYCPSCEQSKEAGHDDGCKVTKALAALDKIGGKL